MITWVWIGWIGCLIQMLVTSSPSTNKLMPTCEARDFRCPHLQSSNLYLWLFLCYLENYFQCDSWSEFTTVFSLATTNFSIKELLFHNDNKLICVELHYSPSLPFSLITNVPMNCTQKLGQQEIWTEDTHNPQNSSNKIACYQS